MGHRVVGITNGHSIHADPSKGTGVSIYLWHDWQIQVVHAFTPPRHFQHLCKSLIRCQSEDSKSAWIPTWHIMSIFVIICLTQILADHVSVKGLGQHIQHVDESWRPSQVHGHGSWLVCEVALSIITCSLWAMISSNALVSFPLLFEKAPSNIIT